MTNTLIQKPIQKTSVICTRAFVRPAVAPVTSVHGTGLPFAGQADPTAQMVALAGDYGIPRPRGRQR